MVSRESKFQSEVIADIRDMFPGAILLKNDASYLQGVPDLLVLHGDTWAALECKRSPSEPFQPNQRYWVGKMDEMSYARFIFPENKDEVFGGLQYTFQPPRQTRFPRR